MEARTADFSSSSGPSPPAPLPSPPIPIIMLPRLPTDGERRRPRAAAMASCAISCSAAWSSTVPSV